MHQKIIEALDALQARIDSGNDLAEVKTACSLFMDVRDLKDQLAELSKRASALNTIMAQTLMPDLFNTEDISTITVEGVRFTATHKPRASIKADKEAGYTWLRDNEYGSIVTETVNANTLSALSRELIENGEDLPDDLFEVYIQANMSVTKT